MTQKRVAKKGGAPKVKSEHREQVVFVGLMRNFYPDALLAAVPNGGARDPRVGATLKAEGVLSGFPDLILMEPRGKYHGAVIEMKRTKGGRVSAKQTRVLLGLASRGYRIIIGRGAPDAFEKVEEYLKLDG